MKQFKGKKWGKKKTTRLDQKCYGPPGYVHWDVEHDGVYASADLTIYDGNEQINVVASGYYNGSRTDTHKEFAKVQRSTKALIRELEQFLHAVDEMDRRLVEEINRYDEWTKHRDTELKKKKHDD